MTETSNHPFEILTPDLLIDAVEAQGFVSDGRIGDSHLNVPGHDGKLGYGGTCFPKDVNAILSFSKNETLLAFFSEKLEVFTF